ncbi:hypothetical protein EDC01DRAFT_756161 [Geopyxis carbonaria]|nr:hypothetical protein EDC01DRAFT_756161 [Geopyxis carbonaria]
MKVHIGDESKALMSKLPAVIQLDTYPFPLTVSSRTPSVRVAHPHMSVLPVTTFAALLGKQTTAQLQHLKKRLGESIRIILNSKWECEDKDYWLEQRAILVRKLELTEARIEVLEQEKRQAARKMRIMVFGTVMGGGMEFDDDSGIDDDPTLDRNFEGFGELRARTLTEPREAIFWPKRNQMFSSTKSKLKSSQLKGQLARLRLSTSIPNCWR